MKCVIYTDGSSKGNPGSSGFGVYTEVLGESDTVRYYRSLLHQYNGIETNNHAELKGFYTALLTVKEIYRKYNCTRFEIVSDSQYCLNPITQGWLFNWERQDYRTKDGYRPNHELWRKIFSVYSSELGDKKLKDLVKLTWVKGHNQNPYNELCDVYAKLSADTQKSYLIDLLDREDPLLWYMENLTPYKRKDIELAVAVVNGINNSEYGLVTKKICTEELSTECKKIVINALNKITNMKVEKVVILLPSKEIEKMILSDKEVVGKSVSLITEGKEVILRFNPNFKECLPNLELNVRTRYVRYNVVDKNNERANILKILNGR